MTLARLAPALAALTVIATALSACGAPAADSAFRTKKAPGADGGAPGGETPGELGGDDGPGNRADGGGTDPSSACAMATASAEGSPVFLVFMVDRSASMEELGKWGAATAGLKAFFADPNGNGLRASLQFFPGEALDCSSASYASPAIEMTPLPDATRFGGIIDQTFTVLNGTPTLPALQGAHAYAASLRAQSPDVKVAVVLVTDGEPTTCGSSVETAAAEAATFAANVPTYVLGVGDSLDALNVVAQSGGTKQAVLVSTLNPASIAADFGKAIADIRLKALACEYKVPAPPTGEAFDLAKVNVQFTPGNGTATTLSYNKGCDGGVGWHYDDVTTPTKILVCPASCDALTADARGKVDILFGCATKGGIIR